jgi:hypothetical protein
VPQPTLTRVSPERNAEKRSGRKSSGNLAEEAAKAAAMAAAETRQSIPNERPPARGGPSRVHDEVTREVRIPSRPPREPSEPAPAAGVRRRSRSRPSLADLDGARTTKVRAVSPPDYSDMSPPVPPAPDTRPRHLSATDEMDDWPTQAIQQDELAFLGESTRPGATYEVPGNVTQAMKVVVWQTPEGLRVSPAGTLVNAISMEAMLVALDPSTDLAAWLAQKKG